MSTLLQTTPRLAARPRRKGDIRKAWPYLVPGLALYAVFVLYPMVDAVRLAFNDWNGFQTTTPKPVGFENFRELFTNDPVFWTAFRNSLIWMVLSIAIPTTLGLLLALAMNRSFFGRNVLRSVFYLPAVLASIAVASMWRWIYNPTLGLLNNTLKAIGLDSWAHGWLADPKTALYSVFVASVWAAAGYNMVLFLAGLQAVEQDQLDAARVDGANTFQVFRFVTLPALRPTTVVVLVLTIINSLKVFDLVVGMTGGGPAQATQVLALWSYTQSFGHHEFGMGNAIATVLLVMSLVAVVPYIVWVMRGDDER